MDRPDNILVRIKKCDTSSKRVFVIGVRNGCPREVFFEREDNRKNQELEKPSEPNREIADTLTARGAGRRISFRDATCSNSNSLEVCRSQPEEHRGRLCLLRGRSEQGIIVHNNRSVRIRKLTPTECSRLMGLEDDWLRWGLNEKGEKVEISDSQRYKMVGNGVVVPVVEHLMREMLPKLSNKPKGGSNGK